MIKTKLKASLYHLLISAGVVSIVLSFIFFYWYPGMLAEVSGLTKIVIIMVSIDLVLGPLLTFVVFKPNKPKLAFDLGIIALIQITALSYALFTIYEGHPLYIAYAGGHFTLISANEVNPNEATHEAFKKSKLSGRPSIVYVKQPEGAKEAEELMFDIFAGAPDIDRRPKLYEPINDHLDDIFSNSIKPEKLLAQEDSKREFMKFIDRYGDHQNFAFLPLSGRGKDVIWALSKKTGKPVGIIDVDPWSMAKNKK